MDIGVPEERDGAARGFSTAPFDELGARDAVLCSGWTIGMAATAGWTSGWAIDAKDGGCKTLDFAAEPAGGPGGDNRDCELGRTAAGSVWASTTVEACLEAVPGPCRGRALVMGLNIAPPFSETHLGIVLHGCIGGTYELCSWREEKKQEIVEATR